MVKLTTSLFSIFFIVFISLPCAGDDVASSQTIDIKTKARDVLEELDTLVEVRERNLAMKDRTHDIFGLNQDAKKQVAQKMVETEKRAPVVRKTALAEVLKRMELHVVMPSKGSFRIGQRTFYVNDRFPVKLGRELHTLRVESVTSRGVIFRNEETGERAIKSTQRLAEGISRGNRRKDAEGIIDLNKEKNRAIDLTGK
ncbi:MAG: hypothetical protein Q7Q71_13195 [Verrucomicrobiota bacterium JB023]|nr:hypothetical protein [Verrucomicrobiota bacterium JB023]